MDCGGDFFHMGLEREVASVQEFNGGIRIVAAKSFGTRRNKKDVVLAPNREHGRLEFAKVGLKFWVELYVVGVVQIQIKLNFFIARAFEQSLIRV